MVTSRQREGEKEVETHENRVWHYVFEPAAGTKEK